MYKHSYEPVYKEHLCKCTETFRCNLCLWSLIKLDQGYKCECGNKQIFYQIHSQWCKMFCRDK